MSAWRDSVREHKPGAPVNVAGDGGARRARRIGFEYFAGLRSAVAMRSEIGVLYETPAQHLIQDDGGRVIGVAAVRDGRILRVRASRGVVLTTGGYEFSDEMKINYLKASPMYFYGNPGNTGDGIRMAQEAGADLWHMNQMVGRAIGHFELDGRELNFVIGIHPPGYVITDRYGRRFANEYPQAEMKHSFYYELLRYDAEKNEYPRNPCYWFFDQRHMTNGPLVSSLGGTVGAGYYDWSQDNSRRWPGAGSSRPAPYRGRGAGRLRRARRGGAHDRGLQPGLRGRPGCLRAPGRVADPAGLAALLLHAAVPGRAEHLRRPAAGSSTHASSTRSGSRSRGCTARANSEKRSGCCTRPTAATCRSRCASAASPPRTR